MATMPFGKYRNRALTDIPGSYLAWLAEEAGNVQLDLKGAILQELERRYGKKQAPPPPPPSFRRFAGCPDRDLASQLISAGHHSLAKKYHPDRGGNLTTMQRLNNVVDWLKTTVLP